MLDAALTVSDVDNRHWQARPCRSGGFVTGDTLNFTDQNGISGSYNSGTGVLTLTGSASVANYQTALRSITFSSTSDNPTSFGANTSRTITWTVNDGALNSTAATSTVAVTAVNDAPVVTAGATVSFTEQGSAVVLDAALTLSDADNTTLASATVSIGELRHRRHAELHQPERHQRQLRQRHRRAHPDRQRHGGQLPDGAALDHLLLDQRQPDQLRRQPQPHDQLDGQRRRPEQHRRDQHGRASRRSTTPRW